MAQPHNPSTDRAEQRFEMLDQISRNYHRAPAIGPVDTRRAIEKIATAMARAGAVFIDEGRVYCAPVRELAA